MTASQRPVTVDDRSCAAAEVSASEPAIDRAVARRARRMLRLAGLNVELLGISALVGSVLVGFAIGLTGAPTDWFLGPILVIGTVLGVLAASYSARQRIGRLVDGAAKESASRHPVTDLVIAVCAEIAEDRYPLPGRLLSPLGHPSPVRVREWSRAVARELDWTGPCPRAWMAVLPSPGYTEITRDDVAVAHCLAGAPPAADELWTEVVSRPLRGVHSKFVRRTRIRHAARLAEVVGRADTEKLDTMAALAGSVVIPSGDTLSELEALADAILA